MEKKDHFLFLLQRYFEDTISITEIDELFKLISSHEYDAILGSYIHTNFNEAELNSSNDLPPYIAQEIIRNIFNAERNTSILIPATKHSLNMWRWSAAAAILIIIFSIFFFTFNDNHSAGEAFSKLIPDNNITKKNIHNNAEEVKLSDGSIISLSPNSSLHYPIKFSADKREVFLEGKAFFQIAKNSQKPFLVYYNNVVAKVLGTSFTINTNPQSGNVEVDVKTGKVQVYENNQLVKIDSFNKPVIVTPNQKAIYKIKNRVFETTLVEKPLPISDDNLKEIILPGKAKLLFIYEQEKLLNVFKQIEISFGIEIIPENSNINNCIFTGDLVDDDLFKMLKILCITTNSSYEVNGTKILIKGQGCN